MASIEKWSLADLEAERTAHAATRRELDELRAQIKTLKAALSIQTERVIRTENTLKAARQELAAASARIRELKGQTK